MNRLQDIINIAFVMIIMVVVSGCATTRQRIVYNNIPAGNNTAILQVQEGIGVQLDGETINYKSGWEILRINGESLRVVQVNIKAGFHKIIVSAYKKRSERLDFTAEAGKIHRIILGKERKRWYVIDVSSETMPSPKL